MVRENFEMDMENREKYAITVCDDNDLMCEMIVDLLYRYSKERGIAFDVNYCHSGKELMSSFIGSDIFLLDVEMPGEDGFDLANSIRSANEEAVIVFLTINRDRIKEAFKCRALRYVTKPVQREELWEALDAAYAICNNKKRVVLSIRGTDVELYENQISYIEGCGDFVRIHYKNQILESYKTLDDLERELSDDVFVRCHKSYLINLGCVLKISGRGVVLLKTENEAEKKEIPVARRRKRQMEEKYMKYDLKRG